MRNAALWEQAVASSAVSDFFSRLLFSHYGSSRLGSFSISGRSFSGSRCYGAVIVATLSLFNCSGRAYA